MKTIQIEATYDNKDLLRAAGVRRVHPGWYTVTLRPGAIGVDASTVARARRNFRGEIKSK